MSLTKNPPILGGRSPSGTLGLPALGSFDFVEHLKSTLSVSKQEPAAELEPLLTDTEMDYWERRNNAYANGRGLGPGDRGPLTRALTRRIRLNAEADRFFLRDQKKGDKSLREMNTELSLPAAEVPIFRTELTISDGKVKLYSLTIDKTESREQVTIGDVLHGFGRILNRRLVEFQSRALGRQSVFNPGTQRDLLKERKCKGFDREMVLVVKFDGVEWDGLVRLVACCYVRVGRGFTEPSASGVVAEGSRKRGREDGEDGRPKRQRI